MFVQQLFSTCCSGGLLVWVWYRQDGFLVWVKPAWAFILQNFVLVLYRALEWVCLILRCVHVSGHIYLGLPAVLCWPRMTVVWPVCPFGGLWSRCWKDLILWDLVCPSDGSLVHTEGYINRSRLVFWEALIDLTYEWLDCGLCQ